jgi:outer membrane lipoprotein-sorting protein
MGTLGETDVIRNGKDVWMWQSRDNTATHIVVPAGAGRKGAEKRPAELGSLPSTPQEAADLALAAIDPSTQVTTTGAASVAGRSAYELVLSPRDTGSLVGQVRLAIDAKQHIPLRVEIYGKGANNPAVRVEFRQISFTVPDAQQFVFNPPAGAKVTTQKPGDAAKPGDITKHRPAELKPDAKPDAKAGDPKVVGEGWTSVVVAKSPTDALSASNGKGPESAQGAQLSGLLNGLPKVSGSWGSGKLLKSTLFSVLLTDDGRVLAGAVAPEKLYEVAAAK